MLEGTLSEFTLTDLFQLLAMTKKSGALRLATDRREGAIAFAEGKVAAAVADTARAELAARLVAAEVVTDADLDRCRPDTSDPCGLVLAASLSTQDEVTAAAVEAAVRAQMHDAVFELMRAEEGTFAFHAGAVAATPVVLLSTDELVEESRRRLDAWEDIRRHLPSADHVASLAPSPTVEGPITLTLEQWRLLTLLDGRRSVRDVVERSGQGEFAISTVLVQLISAGLVEVAEASADAPSAAAATRGERSRATAPAAAAPAAAAPAAAQPPTAAPAPPAPAATPEPTEQSDGADTPVVAPAPPQRQRPVAVARPAATPASDARPVARPAAGDPRPAARPAPVDRFQMARELASLGLDDAPASPRPATVNPDAAAPPVPQKPTAPTEAPTEQPAERAPAAPLTRDEEVNRGLLLRLIDGVKGA